jgi:hypothetical protein
VDHRDAPDVELRRSHGQDERQSVVDARIAVDEDVHDARMLADLAVPEA